jgi:chorismate synthase
VSNTFGQTLRITTFGESHGGAVGVVVDGVPPGYTVSIPHIQSWLDRRRPGQSALSSPRNEPDQVECLSGLENNITLGTPVTLVVRNEDKKPTDYSDLAKVFRPSHADYTYFAKYGRRAASGGGRASARETIGRVAAAGLLEQILTARFPTLEVVGYVDTVKNVRSNVAETVTRAEVEQNALRCPDPVAAKAMTDLILAAKNAGDSVGGIIGCRVRGVPLGIGDPVFDKLEANLAKAMLSLPASKGFEVGLGFASTELYGSEHNDAFTQVAGTIRTVSNRSGGIQGGISNGEDIYFRVAFKPVATIFKEQQTVDQDGKPQVVKPKAGRHDPCVLPRAVPMVEAMAILVIADHALRQALIEAVRR